MLAAVVCAGAILLLVVSLTAHTGETVQIRAAGRVVQTFPLSENRTFEITGVDGGTNLLVIRDGAAWIEEADCPDALCVGMGHIRRVGQSVVCLPHKVVVEVVDGGDDTGVDVLVG